VIICRRNSGWGVHCKLSNVEETVDHLFFHCPLSVYTWNVIREGLQWTRIPKSVRGFKDNFLLERGNKGNGRMFYLVRVVCCILWLNINI
jgi:hypothetical protein